MEKLTILVCVLLAAVIAMALYVHELEKDIDRINFNINEKLMQNLQWHNLQGEVNDRTLKWCKNTDKTLDNMLETQEKLVEMGNETYTKYLEVQAQINGIKFEMEQKDLVAEYCANDALATEAVLIDEEEES